MDGRPLTERIAHFALWTTGSAFVVQALRFSMFVIMARLVTPTQFGVVALALLLVELLQTLATTGMSEALVQKQDLTDAQADTVFWLNLGFGLTCCLGVAALSGVAAQLFHAPILQPVLQVMSIALVIWPIGALHNARIARELGFRALAVRSVIANLLGGGIGIGLALAGAGVWALVTRSLVTLACVVVFAWFKHPWRPRFRFDLGQAPDLLRTGARLTAAQVVSQLGGRGTELIAGLLLTPAAVAMLRVGGQCVDMLMQLSVAPFYQLALPAFSRAVQDGSLDEDVFARLSRLSALAIFPMFFGAMTVASDVLPLMFGSDYAGAGPIMAALCALAIPLQVNLLLTPALTAVGRSDRVLLWALLAATLSLVLSWVGATWGLMGLVGLAVARMYLTLPIGVAWLKRYAGVSPGTILNSIRAPLLAAAGMTVAAYGVGHVLAQDLSVWGRLPLTVATGVAVYGLLLVMLDRSILEDVRTFRRARRSAEARR